MTATVLAIDTAGARLQLAVLHDGRAETLVEEVARGQAEILFARVAALLGRAGLAYADLGRIAVTTGPGSFTGLRIGIAAARGLGLALGVPVIGVPTLAAVSLSGPAGPFAVVLDARRDEAYAQGFEAPGIAATPPLLLPAAGAGARFGGGPVLRDPHPDIAALARFAAGVPPEDFAPVPTYVRPPDAKPQHGKRVARAGDPVPAP